MSEPTDVPLTPPGGTPRFPALPDLPPLPDFPGSRDYPNPSPTIPIPAPAPVPLPPAALPTPRVSVDLPRPSPTVNVEPPPPRPTPPSPPAQEPVALTAAEPPRPAPEGRWVGEAVSTLLRPTRSKAATLAAAAALVGGAFGLQVVFSQSRTLPSTAAARPTEKRPTPDRATEPPEPPTLGNFTRQFLEPLEVSPYQVTAAVAAADPYPPVSAFPEPQGLAPAGGAVPPPAVPVSEPPKPIAPFVMPNPVTQATFEQPAAPAAPPAFPAIPALPAGKPDTLPVPALPSLPDLPKSPAPEPAKAPPPMKADAPAVPAAPLAPGPVKPPPVGDIPPAKPPVEKPVPATGDTGVKLPPAVAVPLPVTPAPPVAPVKSVEVAPVPVLPVPVKPVEVTPVPVPVTPVKSEPAKESPFKVPDLPKPEAANPVPPLPVPPPAPDKKPEANDFPLPTPETKPQPPASLTPAPVPPPPAFLPATPVPFTPALAPTTPPAKGPVRTAVVVDIAAAKPGQTYESLSRAHYQSPQYADALRRYNRDRDPARTDIELPPTDVLRRGDRPAPPVVAAAGATWTPAERPAADPRPAIGTRSYSVPQDGTTFRDLAETLLGRRDRYKQISDLNPARDPNDTLKKGDTVVVPDSAEVRGPAGR